MICASVVLSCLVNSPSIDLLMFHWEWMIHAIPPTFVQFPLVPWLDRFIVYLVFTVVWFADNFLLYPQGVYYLLALEHVLTAKMWYISMECLWCYCVSAASSCHCLDWSSCNDCSLIAAGFADGRSLLIYLCLWLYILLKAKVKALSEYLL